MLVLTRRRGETIFIGEDIRVVLIELQGGQAKIGIACPDHLSVMRAELGPRNKTWKWPNMTPDEIYFLQWRRAWLLGVRALKGHENEELRQLEGTLDQLREWALVEFMERYSHFYKGEEHGTVQGLSEERL